jgi:hypothetical protein
MASKHQISCIALCAAIALELFTGSVDSAAAAATFPGGRPIIVTDITDPGKPLQLGRGLDIARIDGEIVNP